MLLHELLDLQGRTAIVTGAGGMLGPEFAAALAEFGAVPALVDINAEACERAAALVRQEFGVEPLTYAVDLTDEKSVAAMVTQVADRWGHIDILVNAASSRPPGYYNPLVDYDLETWRHVIDVNLTAIFLCTKYVVSHMKAQQRGNIINVASIYGIVGPDPDLYEGSRYEGGPINTPPVYAASKGGVVNFTRYLSTTLAEHNIRVNSITPGGVFSGQNDTFVKRYGARTPLGRMAQKEELRGATLFLASDASSYVTGHNLVVDGGWTAK